jgi:hypothetical protein
MDEDLWPSSDESQDLDIRPRFKGILSFSLAVVALRRGSKWVFGPGESYL